jgi:hypothetical protein
LPENGFGTHFQCADAIERIGKIELNCSLFIVADVVAFLTIVNIVPAVQQIGPVVTVLFLE